MTSCYNSSKYFVILHPGIHDDDDDEMIMMKLNDIEDYHDDSLDHHYDGNTLSYLFPGKYDDDEIEIDIDHNDSLQFCKVMKKRRTHIITIIIIITCSYYQLTSG